MTREEKWEELDKARSYEEVVKMLNEFNKDNTENWGCQWQDEPNEEDDVYLLIVYCEFTDEEGNECCEDWALPNVYKKEGEE